ncbi:hypothetical protein [Limimaricola soesokkakensis]|uniref:hypothetical protein n=1 Tax=Limimaricola soesokkakensis TaxID=1343159 RepID=UPI003510D8BF
MDRSASINSTVLDVVNFRVVFDMASPTEGTIEEQVAMLAKLQEQGLISHIG